MLHKSIYDGPKIDELLVSIQKIKAVANGWIKLESSAELPINFDDLVNPGNFSFDHYTNGPSDDSLVPPLKAIVTKENTVIRQYVFSYGFNYNAYTRTYTSSGFSQWKKVNIIKGVYVGDTAPKSPTGGDIWVNTSNTGPVLQYYDSSLSKWMQLIPDDYLDSTIYNPESTMYPQGIYQYIDSKINNIDGGETDTDFSGHINNNTIHVTNEAKTKYNSKLTSDTLLSAVQKITDEIVQYITNQSHSSGIDIPAIQAIITQLKLDLQQHINDTVKHPSAEQRANWDSKADKDHTHNIEDFTFDTANITGNIHMDQLPDDVKERLVIVSNRDAMLKLSLQDVQNGDFVEVRYSDTKTEVYIVVNQNKLGTNDAFLLISIPNTALTWQDVKNKPTELSQLGIVDLCENQTTDALIDKLKTEIASNTERINTATASYNTVLPIQEKSTSLESLIDLIDTKLRLINKLFKVK